MSNIFWFSLLGTILGAILALGAILLWLIKHWYYMFPIIKKPMLEMIYILKKVSWRNYYEACLRAATGKALERPFGGNLHLFDWGRIQFNPVYLSRLPVKSANEVKTDIILGPRASKPLYLKIPILIGGMSYGSALSLNAKIALAKASTLAGTAADSGNGPFLKEERHYAEKYILQYATGFWAKEEKLLKQADMIEIALGHAAWAAVPVRIKDSKVTAEYAKRIGSIPGLDLLIEARLPEVEDAKQWKALVRSLKEVTGGVPIAVKFSASHYLEKELELFIEGGIDLLIFDGTGGGTHGAPPIMIDDTGLPAFPALCRAAKFIRDQNLKDQVSLVVGGNLFTPGDFAKCLALGADAVIIGTIAALAISHTQITKLIPWEPPTELIYHGTKKEAQYDSDLGAKNLSYFLQSCVRELQQLACSLGKTNLQDLDRHDLVALDPLYAKMAEIEYIDGILNSL